MSKKFILFLAIGSLFLLGAGCVQDMETDTAATTTDMNEQEFDLTEAEMTTESYESDFSLVAVATGPNTVDFSWTVPADMDTSGGFRILSSSKPEPVIPGAYWDWVGPNIYEVRLTDVISGQRYFRICQWLGNQCGEYSSEIELLVE